MAEEYNKSHDHEYERKISDYDEGSAAPAAADETKDRGLFDFLGKKKEEKPHHEEEVMVTEFEKVKVSEEAPYHHHESDSYKVEEEKDKEEDKEKKHGSLLEKLRRSDSSSSSSSDEEEGEGEEKKKKRKEKKGLKDKIKEKISGDHKEEAYDHKVEDTAVPVEKYEEHDHAAHHHDVAVPVEPTHHEYPHEEKKEEEKKGFLEKIKEKLPGQNKKPEEVPASYDQQSHDHHAEPAVAAPSYEAGEPKEKKGILEKIKEKLPGYHPKTEEDKEIVKEKEKDTSSC